MISISDLSKMECISPYISYSPSLEELHFPVEVRAETVVADCFGIGLIYGSHKEIGGGHRMSGALRWFSSQKKVSCSVSFVTEINEHNEALQGRGSNRPQTRSRISWDIGSREPWLWMERSHLHPDRHPDQQERSQRQSRITRV